jgi:hypothetical protein
MSTTSHRNSGTMSLYKAEERPLELLSFRSVFIESGEELYEKKKDGIKCCFRNVVMELPFVCLFSLFKDNIKTLLST